MFLRFYSFNAFETIGIAMNNLYCSVISFQNIGLFFATGVGFYYFPLILSLNIIPSKTLASHTTLKLDESQHEVRDPDKFANILRRLLCFLTLACCFPSQLLIYVSNSESDSFSNL